MPDFILYDISSFPTRVHSRTCCVFRFAIHTFGLYILNACDGMMVWFCPRWFAVDLILPFSDNLSHLSVAARSGRRRARVVQVYSNSWWHFSTARRKTGRIRGKTGEGGSWKRKTWDQRNQRKDQNSRHTQDRTKLTAGQHAAERRNPIIPEETKLLPRILWNFWLFPIFFDFNALFFDFNFLVTFHRRVRVCVWKLRTSFSPRSSAPVTLATYFVRLRPITATTTTPTVPRQTVRENVFPNSLARMRAARPF